MQRTWKYRLYPTATQATELERQLAVACDLYNTALEQRIWAWRRGCGVGFPTADSFRILSESSGSSSGVSSRSLFQLS